MPTRLTLYRGIPGSGKTTRMFEDEASVYLDEDDFYYIGSEYVYSVKKRAVALDWLFGQVCRSLHRNKGNVSVAACMPLEEHVNRYKKLIFEVFPEVELRIVNMNLDYESLHNVPEEQLKSFNSIYKEV